MFGIFESFSTLLGTSVVCARNLDNVLCYKLYLNVWGNTHVLWSNTTLWQHARKSKVQPRVFVLSWLSLWSITQVWHSRFSNGCESWSGERDLWDKEIYLTYFVTNMSCSSEGIAHFLEVRHIYDFYTCSGWCLHNNGHMYIAASTEGASGKILHIHGKK